MSRLMTFRCHRFTPKRALTLTLTFVLTMTLWNLWVIDLTSLSSTLREIPALRMLRLPLPVPLPLPSPLPTPVPRYAVGELRAACSELLGEQPVNKTRRDLLRQASVASRSDTVESLRSLVRNCTALKSQHSYWRWPVTAHERLFPLAFGFKVHDAPDMLERFLRVLWRPHNLYIIHVDQTTPNSTFHIFQDLTRCFDNVHLTETRLNLVYASIVSLHADIECVKTALKSPVPWKYYMSVSGHEFPLKTNLEMVQILSFLNGTNDVENYQPVGRFLSLLKNSTQIKGKSVFLTSKRRTPFKHKDVTLRKGSAYFAATREFLDWVAVNPVCKDFLDWLKETWAADEMYWATANYLPGAPGGGRVDIRHDDGSFLSRAMTWQWDKQQCQGHFKRWVCVFGSGDLKWLLSRPELIANKFDNDHDPLVLDCLEKALEDRAEKGYLEMMAASTAAAAEAEAAAAAASATAAAAAGGGGSLRGGKPSLPPLSTLNWKFYKALPHVRGRGGVVGG